jgi:hypothetical protein
MSQSPVLMSALVMSIGTTGAGLDAGLLAARRQEAWREFGDSSTVGLGRALREINRILAECRVRGWDGEEAEAVDGRSAVLAGELIALLPIDLPRPELAADVDGLICLDWHAGRRRTLSVSVGADGRLYWAALFGDEVMHGSLRLQDRFPDHLASLIRRVAGT